MYYSIDHSTYVYLVSIPIIKYTYTSCINLIMHCLKCVVLKMLNHINRRTLLEELGESDHGFSCNEF
jgi:hypothetical protein